MKKSFVFLTALTLGMTSLVQAGKERLPEELLNDHRKGGTILKKRLQKHHTLVSEYRKKFDSLPPPFSYSSLLDLEKALNAYDWAQLLLVNVQEEVKNLNPPSVLWDRYYHALKDFERTKKMVVVAEKSYKKCMGDLKSSIAPLVNLNTE